MRSCFFLLVYCIPYTVIHPPVKRIVQEAKANGLLIDATCGRKCKSVLITDSNHVVLSAISCEAIQNRSEERDDKDE